ncbi:MAG: DUF1844 domain-containing protein [Deltaproteobacteria bacterium]|nr:DUF1844 domain-containing protein [Deltaproteobacteria bacterium]
MSDNKNIKQELPKIDFSTFINSIAASALVNLGMMQDTAGESGKNLLLAQQSIDILGVIQEKTKNNLTNEEENLLINLLHDLRLAYVKAEKDS